MTNEVYLPARPRICVVNNWQQHLMSLYNVSNDHAPLLFVI